MRYINQNVTIKWQHIYFYFSGYVLLLHVGHNMKFLPLCNTHLSGKWSKIAESGWIAHMKSKRNHKIAS